MEPRAGFAEAPSWHPERPRIRPARLVLSWIISALALVVAAAIVPGAHVEGFWGALLVAAVVALLNAFLPPLIAALRLPFTLALGFVLVLIIDAVMLLIADSITEGAIQLDSFWAALLVALVAAAVSVVLDVMLGANDDDTYTIRVIQRLARRSGERVETAEPGIIFLEIDGLALPVLRNAMRDGNASTMARWLAEDTHRLAEWEPDLSSQTGASQAGILLGSNEDISAFRWVEKETGTLMTCSAPPDCAEIERRHATGIGLLRDGGASRGNLLSGEADHLILTVSKLEAEKKANPGYRAFLANGFNVTRALVLFFWEVILEITASARQRRRDVRPRGHRGGIYPLMRAAMCVVVRDLIVYGVLTDMMKGRPAMYATFSSYDEVAHHSGLERADTLEALRKLDDQFGRIDRARRFAPRPYEIVVLSDHGQTQGATFKQRNGYGLDDLVERSLTSGKVTEIAGGDEQDSMVGHALNEATGHSDKRKRPKNDVSDREAVVLGSGNLGLVYLMAEPRRFDPRGAGRAPSRPPPRAAYASARRLAARPLAGGRRRRPRREGHPLPRRRPRRGGGSPRAVLSDRGSASPPHGRLRARGRHHGRELLRPRARRGLRLRGADLLPRRHRWPADAAVHPPPGRAAGARRPDHRCGRGARSPPRLARAAPGREPLGGLRGRTGGRGAILAPMSIETFWVIVVYAFVLGVGGLVGLLFLYWLARARED